MINKEIVELKRLNDNEFYAKDETGYPTIFKTEKKIQAYKSQAIEKLGLYKNIKSNLAEAKIFYNSHMVRQTRLIEGNDFFRMFKRGLYPEVLYLDFKHFYPTIFAQIANHIDESYYGKTVNSVVRKRIFTSKVDNISKTATTRPMVSINDIAKNSPKIDINHKEEIVKLIGDITNSEFADIADGRVAKITRNALAYGFGFQNKNARTNNTSALTMFFAQKIMANIINYLQTLNYEIYFSHTDSFMISHFNSKEINDAIMYSCEIVNQTYFGSEKILHLDFSNIDTKHRFEEVYVLNQFAYIYSKSGQKGKLEIGVQIAGLNTNSQCGLGLNRKLESIQDILSDNAQDLFKGNLEFFERYKDTEFIYSILKYRLSDAYINKVSEQFSKGDEEAIRKEGVVVSKTIAHLRNYIIRD